MITLIFSKIRSWRAGYSFCALSPSVSVCYSYDLKQVKYIMVITSPIEIELAQIKKKKEEIEVQLREESLARREIETNREADRRGRIEAERVRDRIDQAE